ncbi:hypothetical protein D9M68_967580 [compost metagenome]
MKLTADPFDRADDPVARNRAGRDCCPIWQAGEVKRLAVDGENIARLRHHQGVVAAHRGEGNLH